MRAHIQPIEMLVPQEYVCLKCGHPFDTPNHEFGCASPEPAPEEEHCAATKAGEPCEDCTREPQPYGEGTFMEQLARLQDECKSANQRTHVLAEQQGLRERIVALLRRCASQQQYAKLATEAAAILADGEVEVKTDTCDCIDWKGTTMTTEPKLRDTMMFRLDEMADAIKAAYEQAAKIAEARAEEIRKSLYYKQSFTLMDQARICDEIAAHLRKLKE